MELCFYRAAAYFTTFSLLFSVLIVLSVENDENVLRSHPSMKMSICLCLELESKDIQFITYIKEKSNPHIVGTRE